MPSETASRTRLSSKGHQMHYRTATCSKQAPVWLVSLFCLDHNVKCQASLQFGIKWTGSASPQCGTKCTQSASFSLDQNVGCQPLLSLESERSASLSLNLNGKGQAPSVSTKIWNEKNMECQPPSVSTKVWNVSLCSPN